MKLGMIRNAADNEAFDYVKSKGLSFIEICCNFDKDEDYIIGKLESIKENIKRTGITIGSVGRWNVAPIENGKIKQDVLNRIHRLIDAAHEMGSPVFVTGCSYDDSMTYYGNLTLAIQYFRDLVAYCNNYGMKCGVVNCDWNNWITSPEHWNIILPEVPGLMIKFDSSHAINRGEDYLGIIYRYGKNFCHMHIKGVIRLNNSEIDDPPAGMDQTDWRKLFAILYNIGYDGGLSFEPHSDTWRGEIADAGVNFSINYIKPFIVK